jgi:hypothetical protein
MLADPKSAALVKGFGAQWLRTDEFRNFKPDEYIYKEYNDKLGEAMVGQTLAFFEHVLRKDLPVSTFLDSDFTLANATLAKFYGLQGVTGDAFAVVPLPPGSPRGGLLGQAGVMLRGSTATAPSRSPAACTCARCCSTTRPTRRRPTSARSSPTSRASAHRPRPPAATPEDRGLRVLPPRDRPVRPGLENFNVIGAWRDRQDGEDFRGGDGPPIDAAGKLPNGKAFADYAEFKRRLVEQKDRFRRALAEKMFTVRGGPRPGAGRPRHDRPLHRRDDRRPRHAPHADQDDRCQRGVPDQVSDPAAAADDPRRKTKL